jgi:putative transposase
VLAYTGFPAQHRAKLRSTNLLERLNEAKRRADVVGILPGEPPIVRPTGAALRGRNDERQPQHRCMRVEAAAEPPAPDPETLRLPPLAA